MGEAGAPGLAGVLLAGLVSSADSTVATGYELNVIAAVVVGATSLNGGRGTLVGSYWQNVARSGPDHGAGRGGAATPLLAPAGVT